jgi:hypothetical protein
MVDIFGGAKRQKSVREKQIRHDPEAMKLTYRPSGLLEQSDKENPALRWWSYTGCNRIEGHGQQCGGRPGRATDARKKRKNRKTKPLENHRKKDLR